MKKAIIILLAVISIAFWSRVSLAGIGDTNVTLGYETTDGLDGELTTGVKLGIGYEFEPDNEVRLDYMFQKYSGTTWDASKNLWASQGKSISDANAYLHGLILSIRPYILRDDVHIKGLNLYLQLGLGYFLARWEDITPPDGTADAWGFVPAIGAEYMVVPSFGIGVEFKKYYLLPNTEIDDLNFASGYVNLIYKF